MTLDRVVSMSNGDVVFVPPIRPRLDQGSLIHMQGFIIFLSFFFFALTSSVPSIDGSWLDLSASPPSPYAFRSNWPVIKPQ